MVQRVERRGTLALALALAAVLAAALVGGAEATGRQIAGCESTGDDKCFDCKSTPRRLDVPRL